MLRKYLDREKIIKAYSGDCIWLNEIEEQVKNIKTNNAEELDTIYNVGELLVLIWKMNYIVCETEDRDYAAKYYEQAYDLYSEMKIDLTKMLGIEDIWEEM